MNGPFDIGDVSPRRYFAVAAVVLGLLFAFIAGDDESPALLLQSLTLWLAQACIPMVLLLAAHIAWLRLSFFEALSPWFQLLISGLTGSILFAPAAAALDQFLEPGSSPLSWVTVIEEALNIAPPITLAWIALNAPFVLGLRLTNTGAERRRPDDAGEGAVRMPGLASEAGLRSGLEPVANDSAPAFMDLVAPSIRGRLIYLQAELHYLAVVTERGRSLILYNLRDAVAELPEDSGLLTHRSYWVARQAVTAYRRRGRQGVLTMENGDEVPVSRRRITDVQALVGAVERDAA